MADTTTALFKYVINYNLAYSVENNQISFVPDKQNIMLTEIAVFPTLNIAAIEVLASYPDGYYTHIAEATAAILNGGAEAAPLKKEPVVKNIKATEPIVKKAKAEETSGVNEAAANPGKTIANLKVDVVTVQLAMQKNVVIGGNSFKVMNTSNELAGVGLQYGLTRMKIYLNGKEFQPKQEIEFIKRVFPQIDMTVHLK